MISIPVGCESERGMIDISKSKPNQKAAKTKEEARREQEEMLNSELEDSFPASDTPSLTQPTPEKGEPGRKHRKTK